MASLNQMEPLEPRQVFTIEWEMMDKGRFFAFSVFNTLTLRTVLYPLTVIKTRLQVQKHHTLYKGTWDAFKKILRYEGFTGLYKGYWINSIQVVSGIGYIITYEKVRHMLGKYAGVTDLRLKGLIAGGTGSLVGQTIITPFDVVSQHMMVLGQKGDKSMNPLNLDSPKSKHRTGLALQIVRELYKRDGLKGFYRGYFASLNISVPSSALWWMFYPVYTDLFAAIFPLGTSNLFLCCMAGPISGVTVGIITNPLDVVRARIQVQRINSISKAISLLWTEERMGIFGKGLSARLVQSCISSFFIVLGYETLKRWSVNDQFKSQVRW